MDIKGENSVKKRFLSAVAALAVAVSVVAVGGGSALASSAERVTRGAGYTDGRYLVTFADEAVASYDGYEAGFPATRPHPGRRLDPNSPAVQRWQQHLVAKHATPLWHGSVGPSSTTTRLPTTALPSS